MPLPEKSGHQTRRDDQWRDHPEHQRRSVDAGVGAGADGGSADVLCQFGSSFVEAGLGLGLSALHIARHPNTQRHIVVEFYDEVIRLFRERNTSWPSSLQIVRGDFFEYIRSLQPSSWTACSSIRALPEPTRSDEPFWDEMVPVMVRALRPGGALIPFFSTVPVLRWQYVPHFERVIVLPRTFTA